MDQDADNRDTPMSVSPYDTNPRYRALNHRTGQACHFPDA